MNKDIKAQWVAALRSGEYEQGNSVLRTPDDKFCCLGVLCDLAAKAGVIDEPTFAKDYDDGYRYGTHVDAVSEVEYPGDTSYLPETVRKWADVDMNPRVDYEGRTESLASLNDGTESFDGTMDLRRHSFAEIADLIEASL